MTWLSDFWNTNWVEILVTLLCVLLIQFITGAGGFIKKHRGENIERIDQPGPPT